MAGAAPPNAGPSWPKFPTTTLLFLIWRFAITPLKANAELSKRLTRNQRVGFCATSKFTIMVALDHLQLAVTAQLEGLAPTLALAGKSLVVATTIIARRVWAA